MADKIPGTRSTSAPPGSELTDAYQQLQTYLIHKPSSFFADKKEDARQTWSLAAKELLGNNGAFYTSDIFFKDFDKYLEITPNDVTIHWIDLDEKQTAGRPFSAPGLINYIGYKGASSDEQRAYTKASTEYDAKAKELETYVNEFFLNDDTTPGGLDEKTGTFKYGPTKDTEGKEVDAAITFNFRRSRALPDIEDLKKQISSAESLVTTRIIGKYGKNAGKSGTSQQNSRDIEDSRKFLEKLQIFKNELEKIAKGITEVKSLGIAGSRAFNKSNFPSLLLPHVSLYEYKSNTITLETSTTDYCDAFFNLIDNVNLSLAVPFIRINIIDRLSKSKKREPRMSLVSFLKSTGDKNIDDTIFSNSQPVLRSEKDYITRKILSGKYTGVDVFQSPNTLLPDPTDLIANPRRLDSSVPLMTLQSLNISIESQGTAMLSRKRGELSIIIHDRSRLNDVSSLLSLGDFSSLYFDIEWGYIHPHGDKSFNNPVGQYLNTMRLREIYAPNTYSLSMGEGGALTVNISMLAGGYLDGTNSPVSTGDYVSRSLANTMLTRYITNIQMLTTDQNQMDSYSEDIRPITQILVNKDTEGKFVKRDFIESIIAKTEINDQVPVLIFEEELKNISELKKILEDSDRSQAFKASEFIVDLEKSLKISNVNGFGEATFDKLSKKYTNIKKESFASVGNILTQCAGIPLAMSGLYSEVQMHVFRFNDDAGIMSGLPISQACLSIEDYIGKADENGSLYTSDSVTTALARLCAKLSNPESLTYGIAAQPDPSKKGKADAKDSAPKGNAGKPADSAKAAASESGKTPPTKTPSYTTPNVKFDIRTIPAKIFKQSEKLPIDGRPDPEKPILQIVVYDDNRLVKTTDLVKAYNYLKEVSKKPITGTTSSKDDNVLTIDDAKLLNKIAYPNITYGAVNSVIKAISVSTNSRSALGTYATIQAGKEMLNDQIKSATTSEVRQIQLIPGSVTLTIFGLPIIERGQSIYLDMGTGTTLDQLYKVTAVRHNLSNDFTTDLTLQFVGQGTLVNMENVIDEYLKGQEQLNAKTTPAVPAEPPTSAPTRSPDAPSKSGDTTGIDPLTGRPLGSL